MCMFGCRYNRLLETVHNSLQALLKALKGLVVMSQELENMANSLFINSVPSMWAGKVTDTLSYCRKLITSFKFWFDELLLCFSSNYRLIIIYRHVLNQIFLKLCRKKIWSAWYVVHVYSNFFILEGLFVITCTDKLRNLLFTGLSLPETLGILGSRSGGPYEVHHRLDREWHAICKWFMYKLSWNEIDWFFACLYIA